IRCSRRPMVGERARRRAGITAGTETAVSVNPLAGSAADPGSSTAIGYSTRRWRASTAYRREDPVTELPRDVDELRALTAAGGRVKYLFFWGHRPQPDGSVGPGCLSQWWPAPFAVDGVRYASAEHYMMAGKARVFGDQAIL